MRRFLFSSSCSLYGAGGDGQLDENAAFNPVTPYGESKVRVEQEVSKLADDELHAGLPAQRHRVRRVAPAARRHRGQQPGGPRRDHRARCCLQSDGTPWRPLVHIRDIIHAFELLPDGAREMRSTTRPSTWGAPARTSASARSPTMVAEVVPNCEVAFAAGGVRRPAQLPRRLHARSRRSCPGYKPTVDAAQGHRGAVQGLHAPPPLEGGVDGAALLPSEDDQGASRARRPRPRAPRPQTDLKSTAATAARACRPRARASSIDGSVTSPLASMRARVNWWAPPSTSRRLMVRSTSAS